MVNVVGIDIYEVINSKLQANPTNLQSADMICQIFSGLVNGSEILLTCLII